MTDRKLTSEEKHLWGLYTKDIKPTGEAVDWKMPPEKPTAFKIKVPVKKHYVSKSSTKLSNHDSLENKDSNWGKKLKLGKAKIDGKIDLHGLTCLEAHEKLHGYLERAQSQGKRVILVVTGKGGPKSRLEDLTYNDFENSRGALRREVPMWLSGGSMRHMIVSFQEARANDGGAGALYVVLKRKS